MAEAPTSFWARLKRPRVLIPLLLALVVLGGGAAYLILLNPGSIFVRWAQAALPNRLTMITIGPYPEERDFARLKREKVKYIVSTLDERLPYEKTLIEREKVLTDKYGMVLKVFPMASIFDRRVFPDYFEQQQKAVNFLKTIDAPAYLHCYLGKHRTLHVRDALIKSGVPHRYFNVTGSGKEYWDLVNRINEARTDFDEDHFAKVLETLAPVTVKDVDVANLRGWSHYRLGLISEATEDFSMGLSVDPTNPRCLAGLGYCYLRSGQPVMAQRQFNGVLEQFPEEESAWVGLGLAYLRLENKAQAAQTFRRVLEMDPANEEVKGYLKQAEAK